MQRLLGTSDTYSNPKFGSAFIFELRKSLLSTKEYYVRVLNKNTIYPGAIRFDAVTIKGNVYFSNELVIFDISKN